MGLKLCWFALAALVSITRRDVGVRRLWLFVGVVYVFGLGPYALFQAYPVLSSVVAGLALRAAALVGVLAVAYYLVYEQRVDERVTA
jgi:predicted ferric reductase